MMPRVNNLAVPPRETSMIDVAQQIIQKHPDFYTQLDLRNLETAVQAIIDEVLTSQATGLSQTHLNILMAHSDYHEGRKYELLMAHASLMLESRDRDYITDSDKELIKKALNLISEFGAGQEDAGTIEENRISKAYYGLGLDSSASQQPDQSVLETMSSISGLTGLTGIINHANLPSDKRDKIRRHMERSSGYQRSIVRPQPPASEHERPIIQPSTSTRLPPRLSELPVIPILGQLNPQSMPSTLPEIEAEVNARLEDRAQLLRHLTNTDNVLYQLKLKQRMMRRHGGAD